MQRKISETPTVSERRLGASSLSLTSVSLGRVKRRSGAEGAACSVQIEDVAAEKQDDLQ